MLILNAKGTERQNLLTIGASIRNDVSAATSSATIHIAGSGRVYLASGATSASTNTDHFNGSWAVDSGTLQVGPTIGTGQALNALGYSYGVDGPGTGATRCPSGATIRG